MERTRIGWPDFKNKQALLSRNGTIVVGWNNDDILYEEIKITQDGWVFVHAHAENHDGSDLNEFCPKIIYVFLNGQTVIGADASSGKAKTHLEATDCNMFPVRVGDIVKYGFNSEATKPDTLTNSPNGYYNRLYINWYGIAK